MAESCWAAGVLSDRRCRFRKCQYVIEESFKEYSNERRDHQLSSDLADGNGVKYPCRIIDKLPMAGYVFVEYFKDNRPVVENVEAWQVADDR
ncbi:hypothetical protein ABH924_003332 [Arthrobacter sp. GAS37]